MRIRSPHESHTRHFRLHSTARQLAGTSVLPKGRSRLRPDVPLLSTLSEQRRPHRRPNGASRALRKTKYRRGQQGVRHFQGNGNQIDQCGPSEPRRTLNRLPGLLAHAQSVALGQGLEGSPIRTQAGPGAHITYETYREFCDTRPVEVVANIAICLIHQANYLLDQQIRQLERDFLKVGGLRERMTEARLHHRNAASRPPSS